MLTQERVKELFDYHEDGYLIRKAAQGNRRAGSKVGYEMSIGYTQVNVDKGRYLLHQLIFLWHHGYIPEGLVDHIDQNTYNNKIGNLREASRQCNARNSKIPSTNKSGVKGVSWYKAGNKWVSQICVNQKVTCIGRFLNLDDAVIARYKKEKELNWEGCDSTSSAYLYLKGKGLL